MRNIRIGSELDLAWNWARAEIESERHGSYYNFSPRLRQLLQNDQQEKLTPNEWSTLIEEVFRVRGPLLSGLRRLGTTWHLGTLDHQELPNLRIMGWSGFRSWSPSGSFEEFVRIIDRGVPPVTQDWLSYYRKLRGSFDKERIKGFPVLVSKSREGPYTIVEGYGRLSVLASYFVEGVLKSGGLEVVLGVNPKLEDWFLHDNNVSDRLFLGK